MQTIAVLGLVACALVASACSVDEGTVSHERDASAVPSSGDPELSTFAADAIADHGVPAVALARVSLHGPDQVGVAGTRSHDDDTPVTGDSRFHLGSDTKAMTAVLVAQLVASGELDLGARIADVLPDAEVDPSLDALTVRQVLDHRSGLVDDLDLSALRAATDSVAARREAVHDALRTSGAEPGRFVYANVNYMLAGVLLEEVTGRPWVDLIQERLFAPLGMPSCGFGAPLGDRDPLGHTASGTPVAHDAQVTDNPAAMDPAGRVHCSIGDWAKFATAMLQALAGSDSEILSADTASDLFAGTGPYVAGWVRTETAGQVSYAHSGSNTLWYARAILRPEQGDAALIAVNTGEDAGTRVVDELTSVLLSN